MYVHCRPTTWCLAASWTVSSCPPCGGRVCSTYLAGIIYRYTICRSRGPIIRNPICLLCRDILDPASADPAYSVQNEVHFSHRPLKCVTFMRQIPGGRLCFHHRCGVRSGGMETRTLVYPLSTQRSSTITLPARFGKVRFCPNLIPTGCIIQACGALGAISRIAPPSSQLFQC